VRITQILSNLLSNAVKFTEAGEAELSVLAAAQGLRFVVSDTGIGFDEEVRRRLFRRFEQADASITRRFGGTGLGLAICRSLTEMMGGVLHASSTPGVGSRFEVFLPLERVSDAASSPAPQPEEEEAVSIDGVRILLAEDHPTNQKVVRLILEAVGVDLTVVENGREALDRLAQQDFDLILMDMQMPEMDGLTATAALRARERAEGAARIPVIMLTANALDEHMRASAEAGADLHISKPLRADALLNAIVHLLAASPRDGEAAAMEAAGAA
jgi:CheY-like chemotaxis protein/anti-sigma regulatory factor (Ser/Thr protein kinase)